jgi:hypothetical protein
MDAEFGGGSTAFRHYVDPLNARLALGLFNQTLNACIRFILHIRQHDGDIEAQLLSHRLNSFWDAVEVCSICEHVAIFNRRVTWLSMNIAKPQARTHSSACSFEQSKSSIPLT